VAECATLDCLFGAPQGADWKRHVNFSVLIYAHTIFRWARTRRAESRAVGPASECHTRKRYLRNLKDSLSLAGRMAAIRCKDTAAL